MSVWLGVSVEVAPSPRDKSGGGWFGAPKELPAEAWACAVSMVNVFSGRARLIALFFCVYVLQYVHLSKVSHSVLLSVSACKAKNTIG